MNYSGVGKVTIAGTVKEQRVTLSGVGKYDSAALVSDRATVDNTGFGAVVVNVSQSLDARLNGLGSIEYTGVCGNLNQAIYTYV